MTAPTIAQAQVRADDERGRAARSAEIAERHEEWVEVEPFLGAFHQRMATLHRQVQRQHLTAAALHAARARRVRTWGGTPGGSLAPSMSAAALPRTDSLGLPVLGDPTQTGLVTLIDSLEIHAEGDRFLSGYIAQCVALLEVTAAALLVTDDRGGLRTAIWSSEAARMFAGAELSGGAGPSIECHLTGGYHAAPPATALTTRWPDLAGIARAARIGAVYTIPLRRQDAAFGVLTLLDERPSRPNHLPLHMISLLTAAAAVGLSNQRTFDDQLRLAAQLQSALTSRVAIEQAKGMLAERLCITLDAAFDLLRRHARANNRNLHGVAAEIIDSSLEIVPGGPERPAPLARTSAE